MKKIIISVTNDLVSDNRVHKVATSLHNAGFEVLLVGRKLPKSLPINRKYKTKRLRLFFKKSVFFYAEFNFRLFIFLIFKKFNIILSNDLDTLLANYLAAKLKSKKIVYDSHELFTEVPEILNKKFVKKTWQLIESKILPRIKYSYTVCDSIANYYNQKYKINMKVVRNVPFKNIENFTKENNNKKILLYQGAVNIGRGIEEMVLMMKYLQDFELWIIGDGDILPKIKEIIILHKVDNYVKLFGKIPFSDLPKYTSQADLGLSFEKNLGLNYYYTLPNKIFDYINFNIPVLCANLPEMKNIVQKYDIGTLLNSYIPDNIALQIQDIFKSEQISKWKNNTIAAKKELCWENEEKILLNIFDFK